MDDMKNINIFNKKTMITVLGAGIFLAGCSSGDSESIAKIDDKDFTKQDYITMLNDSIDVGVRQSAFIDKVTLEASTDKTSDKLNKRYTKEIESKLTKGDSLTDEQKKSIKEASKQQAGMIELIKKTDLATDKAIDKKYKEKNKQVMIDTVLIPVDVNVDENKVKSILEKEKDSKKAKEKINKLSDDINLDVDTAYTEYNIPYGLEDTFKKKKGEVFVQEMEGTKSVVKVNDIKKLSKEDLKEDIILTLGKEKVQSGEDFIKLLEDEKVINLDKEMKDYLGMEQEK